MASPIYALIAAATSDQFFLLHCQESEIKFQVNDVVAHPKFGEGIVEEVVQLPNSVRLHIRFPDNEVRKIDQKWLLRSKHK